MYKLKSYAITGTQPATVIDNNDPKGLGRVKVKFAWQREETSPWLRMTNPHAGGGKGMYFIPEKGEEVFIGFEDNNAEKPFVLGAMYNGNERSGYATSGNDNKVIQSRSGTKIILNDAQGSVFVEDPSGNIWTLDGKGNINATAPNDITFTAGKNMAIHVGQNLSINAGMNINETVGINKNVEVGGLYNISVLKNFALNVMGTLFEIVKGNRESETSERNEIAKSAIFNATEKNIVVNSAKKLTKNSGEKTNSF